MSISVPDNMKIRHQEDFRPEELTEYADEPYFRLKHDLRGLEPAAVPHGFSLADAEPGEFAAHINQCYEDIGVTEAELEGYAARKVYAPRLWIALRDNRTGGLAATGIAELDREMGEGILEWIQVSENYRGRGLGRWVVLELLRRMGAEARFATVSGRCNHAANPEALYRKCGFSGTDVWHILRKK